MTTLRRLAPTLAVVIVLALAGCTPATPATDAATSAPPVATPTTTPGATTPAGDGKPALADLVVSPAGVGPILVGQPVPAESDDTAVFVWDDKGCESRGIEGVPGGLWVSTYPKSSYFGADDRGPFDVATVDAKQDGAVNYLAVWSADLKTEAGIAAGATVDELKAAYPSFDETKKFKLATVYAIDGPTGRLFIEVGHKVADLPDYWEDQVNTVLWMSVVPAGTTIYSKAGGDSSC